MRHMDGQKEPEVGNAQPNSDKTPLTSITDFHSKPPEQTHMHRGRHHERRNQRADSGAGQAYERADIRPGAPQGRDWHGTVDRTTLQRWVRLGRAWRGNLQHGAVVTSRPEISAVVRTTRGCSSAEEHPQQPVSPIPLPPDRVREESGDSLALGVDRTRACCFNHGFRFPDYQARNLPQSSTNTE